MEMAMPLWTIKTVTPWSWRWLGHLSMILLLSVCMVSAGCTFTVSDFEKILNQIAPAVLDILSIVSIFTGAPVNRALPDKIGAEAAGLEKLYADWKAADMTQKPGIEGDINTTFQVLQADLQTLFSMANVNDQNTQNKIAALITIVQSAVQQAESYLPASSHPAMMVRSAKALEFTPRTLVESWNKTLTAPTGNKAVDAFTKDHQIHIHNKFWRVVSFGMAS